MPRPSNPNSLRKVKGLKSGTPKGFRRVGKSTGGRFVFLGKPTSTDRTIKLTREPTSIRAEQIHIISEEWKRAGLPIQIIEHRRGRWTQQEYVKGHTIDKLDERKKLSSRDWKKIVEQLGEISAKMYGLKPAVFRTIDSSRVTVEMLVKRIVPKLSFLREKGFLTSQEEKAISTILHRRQPTEQEIVVTHGDLARSNIVYSNGKVTLIDIDPRIELKDLDLARNLEKLRLTPSLHQSFMKSFMKHGGKLPSKKNFSFMQACAAIYRIEIIEKQLSGKTPISPNYATKIRKRQNMLRKALLEWVVRR